MDPKSVDERRDALRRDRQRRRRTWLSLAIVAATVAGIVGMVVVLGAAAPQHPNSPAADTLSPTRSSTPTPHPALSAVPGATGLVLGTDNSRHYLIEDISRPAEQDRLPVTVDSRLNLAATNPAGGWVITVAGERVNGADTTQLATVDNRGVVHRFGPHFPAMLSSVAVSPDGAKVAVAQYPGGAEPVRIQVFAMPGYGARVQQWFAGSSVNQVLNLSWAPDNRRLVYIAGMQTGGGISSDPIILDTAVGGAAPVAGPSHLAGNSPQCSAWAAAWLSNNKLAVATTGCGNTDSYEAIDATTFKTLGAPLSFPDAGCPASLNVSPGGDRVLVSRCGALYLVATGRVTRLNVGVVTAAWAGAGSGGPPAAAKTPMSSAPSSRAAGSTLPTCTVEHLQAAVTEAGAGGGRTVARVLMTNSGSPCQLTGHPSTLIGVDRLGGIHVLHPTLFTQEDQQYTTERPANLTRGQRADLTLLYGYACVSTPGPPPPAQSIVELRLTLPSGTLIAPYKPADTGTGLWFACYLGMSDFHAAP